jgi:hypothetical protein
MSWNIAVPIQVKYARVGAIRLFALGGLRQRPLRCTAPDRELLYPIHLRKKDGLSLFFRLQFAQFLIVLR